MSYFIMNLHVNEGKATCLVKAGSAMLHLIMNVNEEKAL